MLGQGVAAHTDATHGMTLAAVPLPYYRLVMSYGLPKFVRFAMEVWDVRPEGKTDEQIAREGLAALEAWMREIGCVMRLSELGATKDMVDAMADSVFFMEGGYHKLSCHEVIDILIESL